MTAKKAATAKLEEVEEAIDLEPTPDEKLADFFAGLGADDGIRLSVYERDPNDPKARGRLFSIPFDSIEPDDLLQQVFDAYGPGHYEVIALGPNSKLAGGKQRFTLGRVQKKGQIPQPLTPTPGHSSSSSTDPALIALLNNQTKTLEQIAQLVANRSEPPPPKSLAEQLTEFAAIKELFTPPPAPATGGILETVREVFKLRDELGGGESDPLTEAVKTLMPVISKAVERMDGNNAGTQRRAMATAQRLAAPNGGEATPMSREQQILTMYLGQIITLAETGVGSSEAADQLANTINALPDQTFDGVLNFLARDDVLAELAKTDPRVDNYKPWFSEVLQKVLEAFPPAPDAEQVAPGAPDGVDSGQAKPPGSPDASTTDAPTQ